MLQALSDPGFCRRIHQAHPGAGSGEGLAACWGKLRQPQTSLLGAPDRPWSAGRELTLPRHMVFPALTHPLHPWERWKRRKGDGTHGEPARAALEQRWELGSTVPRSCTDRLSYRAHLGSRLPSSLLLGLWAQDTAACSGGGCRRHAEPKGRLSCLGSAPRLCSQTPRGPGAGATQPEHRGETDEE